MEIATQYYLAELGSRRTIRRHRKVNPLTTLMQFVHPYNEETEEGRTKLIACVNLILANYQTNKDLHDTTNATFYRFGSNSIAYLEQALAQNE